MVKKILGIGMAIVMLFAVVGLTACNNETDGSYSDYCCPQYRYNHDFCLTFEISHTTFRRRDASDVVIAITLKNLSGKSHYITKHYLFEPIIVGRGHLWSFAEGDFFPPLTTTYFEKNGVIQIEGSFSNQEVRWSGRDCLIIFSTFWLNCERAVTHEQKVNLQSHRKTVNIRR